jgi:hypothetical protein
MATEISAANVLLCSKSPAACVGKMDTGPWLPTLTTFGDLETFSLCLNSEHRRLRLGFEHAVA